MNERFNLIKLKEKKFDENLSPDEKKIIFFRSMQNFILYFDKINYEPEKRILLDLMELYFQQLEEGNFSFSQSESFIINDTFINPMAMYYKLRFGFKLFTRLKIGILLALHVDLFLLLFGVLKHLYYVPVVTIFAFLHWLYLRIFFVSKNKFY